MTREEISDIQLVIIDLVVVLEVSMALIPKIAITSDPKQVHCNLYFRNIYFIECSQSNFLHFSSAGSLVLKKIQFLCNSDIPNKFSAKKPGCFTKRILSKTRHLTV
jgi:hypothetical protein